MHFTSPQCRNVRGGNGHEMTKDIVKSSCLSIQSGPRPAGTTITASERLIPGCNSCLHQCHVKVSQVFGVLEPGWAQLPRVSSPPVWIQRVFHSCLLCNPYRVHANLPADVTSAPSLLVFRRLLKTELCRR